MNRADMIRMVPCRNPECRDSLEQNPTNPRPMKATGEAAHAWTFVCQTCGSRRGVTKDQIGGTVGQGRTDDMRGKGLRRYTSGIG